MKNLIKIVTLVIFSLITFHTYAQSLSVKGGVNFSTVTSEIGGQDYSDAYESKLGYHIGAAYDMPLNSILSIEPGMKLTSKGAEINGYFGLPGSINMHFLEIPINFKVSTEVAEGLKLYGAVGPYVGFGLFGKAKYEFIHWGTSTEEIDVWGEDSEDDIKRIDAGLTFGGGIEYNSIILGLSYDLGLSNIAKNSEGTTNNNRVLKISVGYRL